jgi:hypothetical protein
MQVDCTHTHILSVAPPDVVAVLYAPIYCVGVFVGSLSCLCGKTIELELTVSGERTHLIISRSVSVKVGKEYKNMYTTRRKNCLPYCPSRHNCLGCLNTVAKYAVYWLFFLLKFKNTEASISNDWFYKLNIQCQQNRRSSVVSFFFMILQDSFSKERDVTYTSDHEFCSSNWAFWFSDSTAHLDSGGTSSNLRRLPIVLNFLLFP